MKKLSFAVLAFAAAMPVGAGTSLGAEPPSSPAKQGEGQEFHADISVQNNMTFGSVHAESERHTGEVAWDAGRDGRFEVNASCGQRITPFFSAFGGMRVHHKDEPDLDGVRAVVGVRSELPLEIDLDASIDHRGHPLLELGGAPRLTTHLSLEWRANTEREFRASVNYAITKRLAVTAGYDTTHGKGVGLRFKS